jgi:hypothetical protein
MLRIGHFEMTLTQKGDDIKTKLKEMACVDVNLIQMVRDPFTGFCKHGDETSCTVKASCFLSSWVSIT